MKNTNTFCQFSLFLEKVKVIMCFPTKLSDLKEYVDNNNAQTSMKVGDIKKFHLTVLS